MTTYKQGAVNHARRCNRLVVEHIKAGKVTEAGKCAELRALWMMEARRV